MALVNGNAHANLVADVLRGKGSHALAVNSLTVESWKRCFHDYALDPARRPEPVVVDRQDLKIRQERSNSLLGIARAEMTNLYQQLAGSGHAVLLTDSNGVVLSYVGDPVFSDTASRSALQNGAVWSEQVQGTNGMGTCLVEQRPLVIHQEAHFFARHTQLTCKAAPIFDPAGELVAVLDASSKSCQAQLHTLALVNMSAQLIENRLLLHSHRDHYILRFHHRSESVSTMGEGLMACDGEGYVRAANRSAINLLDCAHINELLGKPVAQLFNIRFENILNYAHNEWGVVTPLYDSKLDQRFYASYQPPQPKTRRRRMNKPSSPAVVQKTGQTAKLDGLEFGDTRMRRNVERAGKLLERDIPFILLGETGTGKDVFAKAVHKSSSRHDKPFIAVNCASLPETLIESELLGYRPGAFTGASKDGSPGKVVQANGGTLFLDEIGDMPLHLQARLLRVLEEREVIPLGGDTPVKVDIRVISATHRALSSLVEAGSFREDLYYRLNGISLKMPPLREREDRRALIRHLLQQEADAPETITIEDAALDALDSFYWPGNIRHLRNVLRTLVGLCDDQTIRRADLPEEILRAEGESAPNARSVASNPLDIAERDAILRELQAAHWNITRVASKLSISRNTLYRKMKRFDIKTPR